MIKKRSYKVSRSSGITPRRTAASTRQPLRPHNESKLGLLFFCAAVLITAGVLVANHDSVEAFVNRPITKVRADDQWQRLSEEEVSTMLRPFMGAGFFNFDVAAVKHKLEQHPWIENAAVKRQWPDSLSLQLTEEVAIARWGDELLNNKGEIFQPPASEQVLSLPKLTGPVDSQIRVMQQYQLLSQVVSPAGLRLTELALSSRGSWNLELNQEMHVTVGKTDVIEKLQRFVDFYSAQPELMAANIESVDLRYDNGIAIKNVQEELAGVAVR